MQPSRLIRTAILLMALLVPGLGQSREASPQAAHADASPARATVALNQADQAWLSSHGQKIVAGLVPNDLPPFDLVDFEGRYRGISVDYLEAVGRELGVNIEWRPYPSRTQMKAALRNGEIDVVTTAHMRQENQDILYSHNYIPNKLAIVERSPALARHDENTAPTLAFVREHIQPGQLKKYYPDWRHQPYRGIIEALQAVSFGDADAYIGNMTVSNYDIDQLQLLNLKITNFAAFDEDGFSFAVSNRQPVLLDMVNKALMALPSTFQVEARARWETFANHMQPITKVQLSAAEKNWISLHPVVSYAGISDMPPFIFRGRDGQPAGLSVDVMNLIGERTGLKFTGTLYDTQARAREALAQGKAQLLSSMYEMPPDKHLPLRSLPYLSDLMVIVTRKGEAHLRNIGALTGKTVAVMTMNPLHDTLRRQYRGVTVHPASSAREALEQLANGKVDAAIVSISIANYRLNQFHHNRLVISGTAGDLPRPISLGIAPHHPELLDIVNKAIISLSPSELESLRHRWLTSRPHPESSWDRYSDLLFYAAAVVVAALLMILLWSHSLKREVRRRKSAERTLRDQLAFQSTLLDSIPQPVVVRDLEGKLLSCNRSYLSFNKRPGSALVGRRLDEVPDLTIDDASVRLIMALYRQSLEEDRPIFRDVQVTRFGQQIDLLFWTTPFYAADGRQRGQLGGWLDITERARLAKELKVAKDAAESADRAKSTFLSTMSHEIRIPMNAIIGLLDLALRQPPPPDKLRETLDTACHAARQLMALLDDILDVSKIQAGKLDLAPRPVELGTLVDSTARVFHGLARQKGLAFDIDADPTLACWVMADPVRLRQIITNLMSNAIKFTHSGGIRLSSSLQPQGSGQVQLSVSVIDSGVGIDAAEQAGLFQPFVQLPSRAHCGGTGLGLAICKQLIDLMGGEISMASTPGKGTTVSFQVRLDIAPRPAVQVERPDQNDGQMVEGRFSGLRVLIVDDHPANRIVLRNQLEYLGCRVIEAIDGQDGLDRWRADEFDLLITDSYMPRLSGEALTRTIRADEARQGRAAMIIIGLTANTQPESLRDATDAGMTICLSKPVDIDMLVDIISEQLPAHPAHPSADAVSLDRLDETFHGNRHAERTFLAQWRDSNDADLARIGQAWRQQDFRALGELGHRLKGPARLIDYPAFIDACEAIEQASASGSHPAMTEGVARLQQVVLTLNAKILERLSVLDRAEG